jgi:hypothetical protein
MVSSPSTVRPHDKRRILEAALNHMHDKCYECTEASLESPLYRWMAASTTSHRQQRIADNDIPQVRSPPRSSALSCARSARTPASLSCRI